MTTKKVRDTKASSTRARVPRKDLAELATVSRDIAEREQAGSNGLEKRCRHLEKLVEESTATISVLRGQLKLESNERKWSERDIRAALKYAENIIDTVPMSLLVLNADLRVTSASRSFYQTFKVTPEKTMGQLIYELDNRQWDIPRLRDLLEHILPEHTTIEGFEVEHDFPSIGRRVMLLNARRIYREFNHTDLVLLVIEDITELKKAHEALGEIDHMRSEFIASVSHQLRTPIQSIMGFTNLILLDKVPDPKTQKEFITIIDNEATHLAELIGNLVETSRLEAGRFGIQKQLLPIGSLIQSSIKALNGMATERGIEIIQDMSAELPEIEVDEDRLRQVLVNLLSNAIKFSNGSFKVTVKARVEKNAILVQVIDSGIGISEDAIPQLFQKYYRLGNSKARPVTSTGLGLYTSKQIIEAHGGHIWAESKLDKGSTFSFTLPIYVQPTQHILSEQGR